MPTRAPRLAYLLKKFPRLSETFILNEILGQEALGREIRVLSRRRPDDEPRHPQLERLRAEVETLPQVRELDPWETLFTADPDPAVLPRVRALVAANRDRSHPRFPSLLVEALYLLRRTRELGIDHLHVHFASDAAFVAMLLQALGGPTFSLTAHAKDIFRATVDRARLDRIIRASEFTVTVCDANVRFLERILTETASARVRRLYNGIDLERFSSAPSEERDRRHILAVGRLVEKKGFHILLDALSLLESRGVAFSATIVGDGEQREQLVRQAETLGLSGKLTFTGPQTQSAVADLLIRATVFCLPCVEGRDGNKDALPTVLLEALACGLPAVSTPISGIPEILDQGRAGLLVPSEARVELADALEDLLGDAERRGELARAGVRRASRCFDVDRTAAQLSAWFDDVLDARSEEVA